MAEAAAVRVEGVSKVYGPQEQEAVRRLAAGASRDEVNAEIGVFAAVSDASFEVGHGEIFVVMGLSGSGKSTLLRMINGLVRPSTGSVWVGDERVTSLTSKALRGLRARRVSMVFQHFALFPHRTVEENVEFGLEVLGKPVQERRDAAQRALRMVGLKGWGDRYPRQLSGGMQQRVGLARALATNAEILLMDEAFSALDPLIRREMQDQLIELQRTLSKTVVFVSHDLNEAMRIGDHIAIMNAGRIVQIGTPEEVLKGPADDYVASFVRDVDRSQVLTASAVMEQPLAAMDVSSGVQGAMRAMQERQVSGLYVLGEDLRVLGVVLDEEVAAAIRRPGSDLRDLVRDSYTAVPPDTPLSDLCIPAAGSLLPIAVVDDERRLLGVVPRATLLTALGRPEHRKADGNGEHGSSRVPSKSGEAMGNA